MSQIASMLQRPWRFPNLHHSRWRDWVTTETNLSPLATDVVPFTPQTGPFLTDLQFCKRDWALTGAAPARVYTPEFDLTTPFYKLGSVTSANGSVGPDYFNMPLKLHRFFKDMSNHFEVLDDGNADTVNHVMRVLAFKHVFEFTNYSRFPLEIYYSVYPLGYNPKAPVFTATSIVKEGEYGHGYMKKTIPGVLDANDAPKKDTIELSLSLSQLFPAVYDTQPSWRQDGASWRGNNGPWISVGDIPLGTATAGTSLYRSAPPAYLQEYSSFGPHAEIVNQSEIPALFVQFKYRLKQPLTIGTAITGTDANAETTTNGFTAKVKSSWLVDTMMVTPDSLDHTGNKAYPSSAL